MSIFSSAFQTRYFTSTLSGVYTTIGRTGRAKKHGVSYTLVASVTEAVKMRDIARNARMDIQLLKYDKDGCLTLVESPS